MKIERTLSAKKMKGNKLRNAILVTAIALTTVMLTVLLTIFGSISNSQQKEEMRLNGSMSFATIKYLSDEDYESLRQAFGGENVGYRLFVSSQINNEALSGQPVEMSYMDLNYMKTHFCMPSEGNVPVEENEIVCDSRTLKALGEELEIGTTVTIEFVMRNQPYTVDFEIVGVIAADTYSRQNLIVSKEFTEKYAEALENTYFTDGEYSGIRMMDVTVNHKISPLRYFTDKLEECGYQTEEQKEGFLDISINPAFEAQTSVDMSTALGIMIMVFLLLFTGYLVIYNLFEIAITQDIHFWALLRMIGADKKAICRIARYQASMLLLPGIPVGMGAGAVVGKFLFPYIVRTTTIGENYYQYAVNPYILAVTGIFVAVTVYYSARKSVRVAVSVSPVAALQCTDGRVNIYKKKRKVKKGSLRKLAAANIGRNKKRMALVIFSLSISLVLFNCTFILANGIDRERYLQSKMKSDFVIGNRNYFDVNKHFWIEEDALSEEVVSEVNRQEEFLQGGALYAYTPMGESMFEYPDWEQYYETDKEGNQYIVDKTGRRHRASDGLLSCQLYGADDYVLSNFEITEGITDREELIHKMSSGKYLIMSDTGASDFAIGDEVTLVLDGQEYRYTLLAKMKQGRTEYCQFTTNGFCYYVSSEELKGIRPATLMNYSFDVSDIDHMEEWMKKCCSEEWADTSYISAKTYYVSFENLQTEFWMIGSFMSAVIGVIGLMNFMNVMLTSILSRRKEIAAMQSIGMQRRQLRKMLCTEGMFISLLTLSGSFALGSIVIPLVSHVFAGMAEYYAGYITVIPMTVIWMVYFVVSLIVPVCGEQILSRDSLVVRIRQE